MDYANIAYAAIRFYVELNLNKPLNALGCLPLRINRFYKDTPWGLLGRQEIRKIELYFRHVSYFVRVRLSTCFSCAGRNDC